MIEKIKFTNFRGFNYLEISDLKPLTLISGKNNVGKSSILEGIFLFYDHRNADCFEKLSRIRGIQPIADVSSLWEPIFFQMDTNSPIQIAVTNNNELSVLRYEKDKNFVIPKDINFPQNIMNQIISSVQSSYTLAYNYTYNSYQENGHFVISPNAQLQNINTNLTNNQIKPLPVVIYINSDSIRNNANLSDWLGKLEISGKKQQIIDILQIIDSRICDISTIAIGGQVMHYAKVDTQLLPLKLAGNGLNVLLFIISAIISNQNSIILIDEIENGFHYSIYSKLWQSIAQAAKESNCQIIATTHSYECILGAVDGISNNNRESDFCYFRIAKNVNNYKAYRYSDELLRTAITTDMEVR